MTNQPQLSSRWLARSLVIIPGALLVLLAGCAQKTSVQLATEKTSPGWKVQIVQVSEPGEAMVLRRDPGIGVPIGIPAPPPEKDKKWLVVKVNLTPPSAAPKPSPTPHSSGSPGGVIMMGSQPSEEEEERPALRLAGIQLVSSHGEEYPVEAVSTGAMWKGTDQKEVGEFVDPKNSEPVFKDASGGLLMAYQNGWLTFFRRDSQEIVFLFAVPTGAPNLSLRW